MTVHADGDCVIRPAVSADAESICRIYAPYVLNTTISFEECVVEPDAMRSRIAEVATQTLPWLVLESAGSVRGYAYATPWRVRTAYRHSVETSVYLDQDGCGKGHGTLLYCALLNALRDRGKHLAIGGIALPNAPSIALHEKLGFVKVAHFSEVGYKLGKWCDVGYWQLML
jgi:L-amino acid N-acyltransferase YncA